MSALERLAERHRELRAALGDQEPGWLAARREQALARFEEVGLPTPRHEDWRFTDLRALEALALERPGRRAPLASGLAARVRECAAGEPCAVFVDGRLAPELSEPGGLAGVRFGSLRERLERDEPGMSGWFAALGDEKLHPLLALATALFEDGAWIEIDEHASPGRPLHLVFVQQQPGGSVQLRNRVRAGRGSRATLVEHYLGDDPGPGLTNAATELELEAGAALVLVRLQREAGERIHLGAVDATVDAGGRLELFSFALGAALARVEQRVELRDARAHAGLFGLYVGRERQHPDHHTTIDHAAADTTSEELFKGILAGRAHGVFHGRIHVRPDAQRIDANQTSRALLLTDGARVNAKPQLEIYADDVRCSHGASVGSLGEDALFYQRTRGIGEREARALLAQGFAREVVLRLPDARLRDALDRNVLEWLAEAER